MNYVGVLQERCSKAKASLPQYSDPETLPNKTFKCSCTFDKWTMEGTGLNKKIAKQNAAKAMLDKIESEQILESVNNEKRKETSMKSDPISTLMVYCQKEKQNKPLFSERPDEDGLVVIECTFNNFTSVGRGKNKKIAKEMAADLTLKQFDIYEYFNKIKKNDDRKDNLKNYITQLHELCQIRKLPITFKEEHFISGNEITYQVACSVGEFVTESLKNISKREAKLESAELMLSLLNSNTPASSPAEKKLPNCSSDESDSTPLSKKVKISN